jgi:predicted transcriptional regulator
MAQRTLTITMQPDWRAALRAAGQAAHRDRYQGETLNFETPAALFGRLTERRWALVQALLGAGELSLGELSRRVERDVKRVNEDVTALTELGLIERAERGGVVCPFDDIHVDLRLSSKVA